MATNGQEFDPRFDPAFQRGFGGTAGTPVATGTSTQAGRRSAAPVVQQLPPPTPVGEAALPSVEAPGSTRGTSSVSPPAVRDDDLSTADDAAPPYRPWTNPFLIALAVLSVALMAAGSWMFQLAREPFLGTDANSQADYATLSMLMQLAPLLLTLGAATAIGIVFHLAIDWQRRRR